MIMPEQVEARKRSIAERLSRGLPDDTSQPMFSASNIHFEMAERTHAIQYGGIGLIHQLARDTGLIEAIDNNLHLLKIHIPYHESDHVLNWRAPELCTSCYESLVGGSCRLLGRRKGERSEPFRRPSKRPCEFCRGLVPQR